MVLSGYLWQTVFGIDPQRFTVFAPSEDQSSWLLPYAKHPSRLSPQPLASMKGKGPPKGPKGRGSESSVWGGPRGRIWGVFST